MDGTGVNPFTGRPETLSILQLFTFYKQINGTGKGINSNLTRYISLSNSHIPSAFECERMPTRTETASCISALRLA